MTVDTLKQIRGTVAELDFLDYGLWSFQYPCQRKTFVDDNWQWVFYYKFGDIHYVGRGADNSISPQTVETSVTGDPWMTVWNPSESHKFYLSYIDNTILCFKRGTFSLTNHTIVWSARQTVDTGTFAGAAPCVVTDYAGTLPYITQTKYMADGSWNVMLYKSSTDDGTWNLASGYPKTIKTESTVTYTIMAPIQGDSICVCWHKEEPTGSFNYDYVKTRRIQNNTFTPEETISTYKIFEQEVWNLSEIGGGSLYFVYYPGGYENPGGWGRYRKFDPSGNTWSTETNTWNKYVLSPGISVIGDIVYYFFYAYGGFWIQTHNLLTNTFSTAKLISDAVYRTGGEFQFSSSYRNPSAAFGVGLTYPYEVQIAPGTPVETGSLFMMDLKKSGEFTIGAVFIKIILAILKATQTVRGRVSKNLEQRSKLFALAKKLVSIRFNLKYAISKLIKAVHSIRKRITNSTTIKYNNFKRILSTVALQYKLRQKLSKSIALLYKLKVSIGSILNVRFNLKKRIIQTLANLYKLRNTITKSSKIVYSLKNISKKSFYGIHNLRNRTASSLLYKYNIFNRKLATIAAKYHIRQKLTRTIAFPYKLFVSIRPLLNMKFNLKYRITRTIAKLHGLKKVVTKPNTIVYGLKNISTKSFNFLYKIRAKILQNLNIKYWLKGLVKRYNISLYKLRVLANKSSSMQYKIKNLAKNSISTLYSIYGRITRSADLRYDLSTVKKATLSYLHKIRAKISPSLVFRYGLKRRILGTLASIYGLKNYITKTSSLKYTLRNIRSKATSLLYTIRKKTLQSTVLGYKIKALASKTVRLLWHSAGAFKHFLTLIHTVRLRTVLPTILVHGVKGRITKSFGILYSVLRRITKTGTVLFGLKYARKAYLNSLSTVRKNVLKSVILWHGLKALLKRSLNQVYTLRRFVYKTFIPKYTLRNITKKTSDILHGLKGRVLKTVLLLYGLKTVVKKSSAFLHTVRRFVLHSLVPKYTLKNISKKTSTLLYTLRSRVLRSTIMFYGLRNISSKAMNIISTLRGIVIKSTSSIYTLRKVVSKAFSIWHTLRKIAKVSSELKYSMRSIQKRLLNFRHSVYGMFATKFLDIYYSSKTVVKKTWNAMYYILARSMKSLSTISKVKGLKTALLNTSWKLRNTVFKASVLQHKIRNIAKSSLSMLFSLKKIVSKYMTSLYNVVTAILYPITHSLTTSYRVFQQIVADFSTNLQELEIREYVTKILVGMYNLLSAIGTVIRTIALNFNIRSLTQALTTLTHSLKRLVVPKLSMLYSVFRISAKSLASSWRIRSRIDKTLNLVYTILSKIPKVSAMLVLMFSSKIWKIIPLTILHSVRNISKKTTNILFKIRTKVSKSLNGMYKVIAPKVGVVAQLAILYSLRAMKTISSVMKYTVLRLSSRTTSLLYRSRGMLSKLLDSQYRLRRRLSASIPVVYSNLKRVTIPLVTKYKEFVRIAKAVVLNYHMTEFVYRYLVTSYHIFPKTYPQVLRSIILKFKVREWVLTRFRYQLIKVLERRKPKPSSL